MNKKIIVGLSGGIDSSIALFLLKKQGWQPIGVSLNIPKWSFEGLRMKSFESAKKICQILKAPHYIVDVVKDFEDRVVEYFIAEFKNGKTPNPCMICNPQLKFNKLLKFAKDRKINWVATGHYSRIRGVQKFKGLKVQEYQLLKAKDKSKDQTYNLAFLNQEQLKHIIFPLGNYTKKEVREIAEKAQFGFLLKQKESQDFCYCPNKELTQFLSIKIGQKAGKIVDQKGKVLGNHHGLHFFTIGQRKGIHLSQGPWFVLGFNKKMNYLIITKNEKDLYQKELILSSFNFISGKAPKNPIKVMAKIRYRNQEKPATLFPFKNKLKLVFDQPQKAVTGGQFAVFYLPRLKAGDKNICLGGGRIITS